MLISLLGATRDAINPLYALTQVFASPTKLAIFHIHATYPYPCNPIIDYPSASTTNDAITDLSKHTLECTAFLVKSAAYLTNIIKHREAKMPNGLHVGQW